MPSLVLPATGAYARASATQANIQSATTLGYKARIRGSAVTGGDVGNNLVEIAGQQTSAYRSALSILRSSTFIQIAVGRGGTGNAVAACLYEPTVFDPDQWYTIAGYAGAAGVNIEVFDGSGDPLLPRHPSQPNKVLNAGVVPNSGSNMGYVQIGAAYSNYIVGSNPIILDGLAIYDGPPPMDMTEPSLSDTNIVWYVPFSEGVGTAAANAVLGATDLTDWNADWSSEGIWDLGEVVWHGWPLDPPEDLGDSPSNTFGNGRRYYSLGPAASDGVLIGVDVYMSLGGSPTHGIRVAVYKNGASGTNISGATLVEDLGVFYPSSTSYEWKRIYSLTNPSITAGDQLIVGLKSAGGTGDYHVPYVMTDPGHGVLGAITYASDEATSESNPWDATVTNPSDVQTRYGAARIAFVGVDGVGASEDLVVEPTTHPHTADGVALTQSYVLVVSPCRHSHAAEAPAMTQANQIVPENATHGHNSDDVVLDPTLSLEVSGSAHPHTADAPAVTQANILVASGVAHPHAADAPSLEQGYNLTTAGATHPHTAGEVALSQSSTLAVDGAVHQHRSTAVPLVQSNALAPSGSTHPHTSETAELSEMGALVVSDTRHAHLTAEPALTQSSLLSSNRAQHGHAADVPVLAQGYVLESHPHSHPHASERVAISTTVQLIAEHARHAHRSEGVELTQAYILAVAEVMHAHLAESPNLSQGYVLSVIMAAHSHYSETVGLVLGDLAPLSLVEFEAAIARILEKETTI